MAAGIEANLFGLHLSTRSPNSSNAFLQFFHLAPLHGKIQTRPQRSLHGHNGALFAPSHSEPQIFGL